MTITRVEQKPSGWYVITDSDGVEHATKHVWLASLAQRYAEKETEVSLLSFRGWRWRELHKITEVTPGATAA